MRRRRPRCAHRHDSVCAAGGGRTGWSFALAARGCSQPTLPRLTDPARPTATSNSSTVGWNRQESAAPDDESEGAEHQAVLDAQVAAAPTGPGPGSNACHAGSTRQPDMPRDSDAARLAVPLAHGPVPPRPWQSALRAGSE